MPTIMQMNMYENKGSSYFWQKVQNFLKITMSNHSNFYKRIQSDGCYSSGFFLITKTESFTRRQKLPDNILYFLLASNNFKKFCLKNYFKLSLHIEIRYIVILVMSKVFIDQ